VSIYSNEIEHKTDIISLPTSDIRTLDNVCGFRHSSIREGF
jgi:hypothetical protein